MSQQDPTQFQSPYRRWPTRRFTCASSGQKFKSQTVYCALTTDATHLQSQPGPQTQLSLSVHRYDRHCYISQCFGVVRDSRVMGCIFFFEPIFSGYQDYPVHRSEPAIRIGRQRGHHDAMSKHHIHQGTHEFSFPFAQRSWSAPHPPLSVGLRMPQKRRLDISPWTPGCTLRLLCCAIWNARSISLHSSHDLTSQRSQVASCSRRK